MAERKQQKRKSPSRVSASGGNKKAKTAAATASSGGSNLSSSAQKRALKQERQSRRRHADAVSEAKEVWNQLRLRKNEPDQIRPLTTKLTELLRGKLSEVALQHDASRVVQAVIQFGTKEQRRDAVKELSGDIAELSKVQYAHFVVLKMITNCHRDEECVRLLVKALKGSIPKLAVHAVGARVVELLFGTFSNKATAALRKELYGPHFSLFAAESTDATNATLQSNLALHPDKKDAAIEFVGNLLQKGADKALFGFRYYQELFAEYIDVTCVRGATASSVVDHAIHLLSTRAGAKVVAACVAYGTPKDRKKALKSLKGYTRSSLLHRDAYLAVLRVLQVTDDTVSLHKSVLAELLTTDKKEEEESDGDGQEEESSLLELALDDNASKLFLTLLLPEADCQKYLDPYERDVLKPNPTFLEGGKEVPTSKKNPETRRKELLLYLKQPLIQLCIGHAEELMRSLPGSRVLKEVYSSYPTPELIDSLAQVCLDAVEAGSNGDGTDEPMLFEDQVAHFSVKNLLQCDTDRTDEHTFARSFLKKLGQRLEKVGSSNRGAFVLTALCKVQAVRDDAIEALKKHKKSFTKRKKEAAKSTAGYEALLRELK